MNKVAIIFGGSGFIGRHLSRYLLKNGAYNSIIIADLVVPIWDRERITYVELDVREPISADLFVPHVGDTQIEIYHLAALSKIPGHQNQDYFRTNVLGAEHVCQLADELHSMTIVFTSTIAVYGPSEEKKTENSMPHPDNAYGVSKLVAEYIHRIWHEKGKGRRLFISRPGIVYGENENANFTRLYKGIKGGYFLYPGRKDTKKASIYVKDVVRLLYQFTESESEYLLYNLVDPEPHSIEHICRTVAHVIGKRPPKIKVPGWMLLLVASILTAMAWLFGKGNTSLHPDRVRKIMNATNVMGTQLKEDGYQIKYSLAEGLRDWLVKTE